MQDNSSPDDFSLAFNATVQMLVSAHPKYRAIKVGLVAQYLVDATFGKDTQDSAALLAKILAAHQAACRSEQWKKEKGRYAESLHAWVSRRGWEDVLPETSSLDEELDGLRAAGERYLLEKRAR